MSLFADQPNDFLDYLVQQGLPSDPVSFVPRSHFGNYLQQRFEEAVASLPIGVRLVHIADDVVVGQPLSNGGLDLTLSNGSNVLADVLVLSTGNFLPTWPHHLSDAATIHAERFITDPQDWTARHSVPSHWKKLLIVGSGLTMMDLAIDLSAKNFGGKITVLSRRGLLGWQYLAVVLDLFSRQIVCRSVQSQMDKELVISALLMALWRRKPQHTVMIHPDQSSQFSSYEWQAFLKEHNLKQSMSRRGNYHDNAKVESFFQLLERERIKRKTYASRAKAREEIFDYIEMFYNLVRRHSYNDGLSPVVFKSSTKRG